jgi:hypothetical protein
MTEEGFCLFADIGYTTFCDYSRKEDFSQVVTRIKQTIRQQKFTGAAAELLNPNIIARDLGLSDKKDHTSSDGSMTPTKIERVIVDANKDA